jgi:hypothetical protein
MISTASYHWISGQPATLLFVFVYLWFNKLKREKKEGGKRKKRKRGKSTRKKRRKM